MPTWLESGIQFAKDRFVAEAFPVLVVSSESVASRSGRCIAAHLPAKLRASLYCPTVSSRLLSMIVEVRPIEERIKELCESAATADDSEVPALFAELRALLAEHSGFVRYLAARTLNRTRQEPMQAEQGPSSAKAAD